ncbi:MAG TPA: hypothetical protein VKT72_16705 [Candidatus Baltobacteraceae bacterium]|nr:hypothetical protein [Candidatus Baltobacteraceae bacterium]
MNFVRRFLSLSLAALCLVAANPQPVTLIFYVGGQGDTATVARLSAVMKARLRAAGVSAAVALLPKNRVQVSLQRGDPQVAALLEAPGRIAFRIEPRGPVYGGNTTIKAAKAGQYMGLSALYITLADGAALQRFTSAHLNQDMGIYVDGKLLYSPQIDSPIANKIIIVGTNLSAQKARWIAGVLAGGPLPAPVRLVREYRASSTQSGRS